MKHIILATIAILTLGFGSALAQSYAHEAPPAGQRHVSDRG